MELFETQSRSTVYMQYIRQRPTWPGDNTDPNSVVFLFALGIVNFKPSAHFHGWIVGMNRINIQQGNWPTFEWLQPKPWVYQLDFPGLIPTWFRLQVELFQLITGK